MEHEKHSSIYILLRQHTGKFSYCRFSCQVSQFTIRIIYYIIINRFNHLFFRNIFILMEDAVELESVSETHSECKRGINPGWYASTSESTMNTHTHILTHGFTPSDNFRIANTPYWHGRKLENQEHYIWNWQKCDLRTELGTLELRGSDASHRKFKPTWVYSSSLWASFTIVQWITLKREKVKREKRKSDNEML